MSSRHADPVEVTDLHPVITDDGQEEWVVGNPTPDLAGQVHVTGGKIHLADNTPEAVSIVPAERMATNGDWNEIVEAIRKAEQGEHTSSEIVVQPGGKLVPVERGKAGPELSRVPEDRMAASARATAADLVEAHRLDPLNSEQWAYMDHHVLPGLRFTMAPVARRFTFFSFRCPSFAGRWFLAVLEPNLDELTGHQNHMLTLRMGGECIPVVCSGPGDSSHGSIAQVRGTAAKFALYHSLRDHGHVPFSA